MIIDFHMHIFPDELAPKAMKVLVKNSGLMTASNGTARDTVAVMDKAGIDKGVFLNIATKPHQTTIINDWIITLKSDRIIPFGTIHPHFEKKTDEIERLYKNGIKGIKIHPDYQDVYVNDSILFEIYKACEERGMVVQLHAGVDIGMPLPVHGQPKDIAEVAQRFPNLKIVAAHFGGHYMWDDVEKHLCGLPNVYFDTSFATRSLSKEQAERIIFKHSVERILYASDCPWEEPSWSIDYVNSLALTQAEKKAVLGANAAKLLNI